MPEELFIGKDSGKQYVSGLLLAVICQEMNLRRIG